MSKVYKVWVDIEEIDEDEGHYEDLGLPVSTRTEYKTLAEAVTVQNDIVEHFEGWEPIVTNRSKDDDNSRDKVGQTEA